MSEGVDEVKVVQSGTKYVKGLWLILVALATAGCTPVIPEPEKREDESTREHDYIEIPLTYRMQYFRRCESTREQLHQMQRLAWLEKRDTEERTA